MIFEKNVLSVFLSPYGFDVDDIGQVAGGQADSGCSCEEVCELTRSSTHAFRNLMNLCGSHVSMRPCGQDRYTLKWKDKKAKERCVSAFKQLYKRFGLSLYSLCDSVRHTPFFLSIFDSEAWISGMLTHTEHSSHQVIALNKEILWWNGVPYKWSLQWRTSRGTVTAKLVLKGKKGDVELAHTFPFSRICVNKRTRTKTG